MRSLAGIALGLGIFLLRGVTAPAPFEISGIYPHLAYFNSQGECGTGAVVPWADRLWVVTYSPHMPKGSDDKLYEIDAALNVTIRPESIGGTPANRFIHRESQQLFIGPYAIDAQRNVRAIPYSKMYGRPTGNARHLTDPANKIYYASMEEGFYEVDVRTLAVTELFRDEQLKEPFRRADLPGYHGKGFYSGQGWLVYANNGEHGKEALVNPEIASGALAAWDGRSDKWQVIRRNQFTEVTGPGGLYGNDKPDTDPIWSIGWDHRSLILMVLESATVGGASRPDRMPDGSSSGHKAPPRAQTAWHAYRLPKASHSYDGAHGWNTEWPRIRDIGEKDLLMTMHGAFWHFPRTFGVANSAGVVPRSNYLKVIGDFARWGDRLVLGCDDTAMSEFLNKRRAKGKLAGPGQSQSNLWFIEPAMLDRIGPAIGRGAVWLDEPVKKDVPSDAFSFVGFDQRMLHLAHNAPQTVTFTLEVDREGNGKWTKLRELEVGPRPPSAAQGNAAEGVRGPVYAWTVFTPEEKAAWIRIRASRDCAKATAFFSMRNIDRREGTSDGRFAGLIRDDSKGPVSGGLLRARGEKKQTIGFAATRVADAKAEAAVFYEMGADMNLRRTEEANAVTWMQENVAIPADAVQFDAASVIYTDEQGKRFRLPKSRADYAATGPLGAERAVREVCTERDLLNCAGTFFELPAENAGGIAKLRPISTHSRRVHDFATWRGMLVMTGVELWEGLHAPTESAPQVSRGVKPLPQNPHIIRSDDGRVAVWVGAVDDLWNFGKPVGQGGPWKDAAVKARVPSDPYLMTGYDRKKLTLSHTATQPVRMDVEVDLTGTGQWVSYATIQVPPGEKVERAFPEGYQAYWLRVTADAATTATAWLVYE